MSKSGKTKHVDSQKQASGLPGNPPTRRKAFYDMEQAGVATKEPEAPRVSQALELLDRQMVNLAGRLGIHPIELATLRYGEPGWGSLNEDQIEGSLRENLHGEGALGQLACQKGLISPEEAAWLDLRERPTVVRLASDAGSSLVVPQSQDDAEEPHVISPVQYVGKGLKRFWQATAEKIAAQVPTENALDLEEAASTPEQAAKKPESNRQAAGDLAELASFLPMLRKLASSFPDYEASFGGTQGFMDAVDERFLKLAGRLGIHPIEVAALRYGDTGSELDAPHIERRLRSVLEAPSTDSLGSAANRNGLLTHEEARWLDRGDRPSWVESGAGWLGGVGPNQAVRLSSEQVSPAQVVGRTLSRYWLSNLGELKKGGFVGD